MASKPAPDSCPSQSSRVSESIHEGADRIVALIKTEKEKQALFHEAQLKDLESRHNQLKNNTALIYASASLRILRLEAELEDVKKEQLKAITEARAATERVKTELTEANSWLDRLNASLKENGMTYLDGAITFDDETVRRVDELLSEARNSGDVGLGKDAFDADTAQAPSLLIVSGIAQYLKLHKRAILEREDMYRTLKRDGDLGKRRTDEAMDTTADPLDAESIASKPEYSSSTGALKCSDSGISHYSAETGEAFVDDWVADPNANSITNSKRLTTHPCTADSESNKRRRFSDPNITSSSPLEP